MNQSRGGESQKEKAILLFVLEYGFFYYSSGLYTSVTIGVLNATVLVQPQFSHDTMAKIVSPQFINWSLTDTDMSLSQFKHLTLFTSFPLYSLTHVTQLPP